MSALVTVARFESREDAEIARNALAEAGIEAMVSADDVGGLVPLTNGVDVKVLEEHVERARTIILPGDRPESTLPQDTPAGD